LGAATCSCWLLDNGNACSVCCMACTCICFWLLQKSSMAWLSMDGRSSSLQLL
jgi:hypothetical protein